MLERKLAYFACKRMKLASILTSKRMQDKAFKTFFPGQVGWTKLVVCKLQETAYETKLE